MKAIIKFDDIANTLCYAELPIFESVPEIKYSPVYWTNFWPKNRYSNTKSVCKYFVTFVATEGVLDQIRVWRPNLTQAEIRRINEAYFYLLDHPEFKERIVIL